MKKQMMNRFFYLCVCLLICSKVYSAGSDNDSWWPQQQAPSSIIQCELEHSSDKAESYLLQSISGLAALSLNEGTGNEGVWIDTKNNSYKGYLSALKQRLNIDKTTQLKVWDLLSYFAEKDLIEGYILCDLSTKDNSINAATMLCAIYKGVLVDKTIEARVQNMGLTRLADATGMVYDKAFFDSNKDMLNNNLVVLQSPDIPNNRDYAIANKAVVYYGVDSLLHNILEWVLPLSPVIGWNQGPEYGHVAPCSKWGLLNTASDWCMNLPLMTIQDHTMLKSFRSVNPKRINFDIKNNYHSFVLSDGDNMQWTFGGFIANPNYWANPYNSDVSMTFSTCAVNLAMAGTDVLGSLVESQKKNVSVLEYGGAYYYPDNFGEYRPDREILLRQFSRKVNAYLKKTGIRVFGFICRELDSPEALQAYRIFAEELDDLVGMVAVQYAPYNGGDGKTYWVTNKEGVRIPVLTAKYQMWANLPGRRSGNPDSVAASINEDSKKDGAGYSWTIVHAWSEYQKFINGSICDVPDAKRGKKDAYKGITPVKWCKDQLNKNTKVVSIEELLWRLRMADDPVATRRAILK